MILNLQIALEFLLHFGEIMIEAVHAGWPEEQLRVRITLVEQLLDVLLGLEPQSMHLSVRW